MRDRPLRVWLPRRVVEGVTERALGCSLAVEVRRRPAVDEGPAGAEDEAQVDVLDLWHDTFIEHDHVMDILRVALHQLAQADLGGERGDLVAVAAMDQERVAAPATEARDEDPRRGLPGELDQLRGDPR